MGLLQSAGKSIANSAKSGGVLSQIGNAITGTGDDPGIFGLGQHKAKPYEIDETAFKDTSKIDARKADFANELKKLETRTAPKAFTTKIDNMSRMEAAQIGAMQNMAAAQIGNITPAQAAQIAAMREIQGANINTANSDQVRAQQMLLAQALTQQSAGLGPSIAQTQLRQGTDRNIAQAMALAASARGGSAGGLGLRQIRQQTSDANQQAAQQAALIRAQEQMTARDQLSGVLSGVRGADIGLATSQADLMQQANMANQSAVNQAALAQAQLQQQTSLANLDVSAQKALAQAQFEQQASATNTSAANEKVLQQAQLQQQAAASNQSAINQRILEQAKLNQGTALANQQSALQQTALNDALREFYESQGVNLDLETMHALQQLQALKSGQNININNINQQGYAAAGTNRAGVAAGIGKAAATSGAAGGAGGAAGGAGAAAAASDENLKDITAGKEETKNNLKDFVKAIGAHQYTYKDKKWGGGEYISPMAQELEKSKLGKDMVVNTPEGKMVDYGRGFGTMLATASMLNERLDDLEKALSYRAKKRA